MDNYIIKDIKNKKYKIIAGKKDRFLELEILNGRFDLKSANIVSSSSIRNINELKKLTEDTLKDYNTKEVKL